MKDYFSGNLVDSSPIQIPESIILAPRPPGAISTTLVVGLVRVEQVLRPLSKAHIRPLLGLTA
jgi:hypothetical protein